jgi:hypothetical protein
MTDHGLDPELIDLLTRDEPLHPDLEAHLIMTDFGRMVHHPLIIEIMPRPAMVNYRYEAKRKALHEAMSDSNWHQAVWLHERPYRLDAFMQIEDDLDDDEYWSILADIWLDSENIWQNLDQWRELFESTRSGSPMTDEEEAALAAMPDPVPVYRGSVEDANEYGLSWTTDRERAEWFAVRMTADDEVGVVLDGLVAKEHVAAYFTGRGEDEIVVFDADLVDVVARATL